MAIVINGSGTVTGLAVGGLPDGTVDADTVAADVATQAELDALDLSSIRRDIGALALHSAVADNKAAYNLPNSFIDQFEDDTGIATETNVDRNSGEYIIPVATSAAAAFTSDSNTLALLHFDGTNNSTLITDSSSHSRTVGRVSTEGGRPKLDTDSPAPKFGTAACYFGDGTGGTGSHGNALTLPDSNDWNFGSSEFTFETWIYMNSLPASSGNSSFELGGQAASDTSDNGGSYHWNITSAGKLVLNAYRRDGSSNSESFTYTSTNSVPTSQWVHVATTRDGNTYRHYVNGVASSATHTSPTSLSSTLHNVNLGGKWWISRRSYHDGYGYIRGFLDEYRLSNTCRYPNGTAFTPNTTQTIGATGTLISTAQTASSAQTKVSGVFLYKNNAGTATLGTDIKVYFTCNGGTNWTESTPVAAGTFSTGILMAKCPQVTCTSGTDVRYKAVWANQAAGSKETQLHGIAMNY